MVCFAVGIYMCLTSHQVFRSLVHQARGEHTPKFIVFVVVDVFNLFLFFVVLVCARFLLLGVCCTPGVSQFVPIFAIIDSSKTLLLFAFVCAQSAETQILLISTICNIIFSSFNELTSVIMSDQGSWFASDFGRVVSVVLGVALPSRLDCFIL